MMVCIIHIKPSSYIQNKQQQIPQILTFIPSVHSRQGTPITQDLFPSQPRNFPSPFVGVGIIKPSLVHRCCHYSSPQISSYLIWVTQMDTGFTSFIGKKLEFNPFSARISYHTALSTFCSIIC